MFNPEKTPPITPENKGEKEEEKGSEESENNDLKLTQEEIAKELDSRAMRVDETVEEYNEERKKSLEEMKQDQSKEDREEIEKIRQSIGLNKEDSSEEMASPEDACEQDLLGHLNSPDIDWGAVEGRIGGMLTEIQEVERSDKTYEIIEKVAKNIANWLKENAGKYDNGILSSEAVKHAVKQAEENFSKLKGEGQEAKETESEEPKDQTAEDIKKGFEILAEGVRIGFNEGVKKKIVEYDKRIRAVLAGKPLKDYDKLEDLEKDFKQLAKTEWTKDFTSEKL